MVLTMASSPSATCHAGTETDTSSHVSSDRRRMAHRMHISSASARLQRQGPHALSDVELLSLVLRSNRYVSTWELSENLLASYGSLRPLILADPRELLALGLTPSNYVTLQCSLELARRHYEEPMRASSVLSNPKMVREFLRMQLRDLPHEVFCCLYLDNHNRLISFEELFRGTIDGATVHPREVVKRALTCNAAAIILAHNHPSGVAEPSQADEIITRRLKDALSLVGISVLDHLVIGDCHCESFAARGLL